jgi:hypothetical protein
LIRRAKKPAGAKKADSTCFHLITLPIIFEGESEATTVQMFGYRSQQSAWWSGNAMTGGKVKRPATAPAFFLSFILVL